MEYPSLKGKVAIVTGSASGIGAASARRLASSGVILSLIDLNGEGLKKVAEECVKISAKFHNQKPFQFVGDLSKATVRQQFVQETVKTFGRLDILVNNAGISSSSSMLDETFDKADNLFEVMLKSPYDMCRLASKHLIATQGCIVNIGSVCGTIPAVINPGYCVSKAGIIHLTRCIADELGPYKVRANTISPGAIKTNLNAAQWKTEEDKQKSLNCGQQMCPMKRSGEPEEIANVVAFLASTESSYMNGSDVLVDGGLYVQNREGK